MDIVTFGKGADHVLIPRHRRKHPQLDLRVVGIDKHVIVVLRHEILPHLPPQLRPYRNVLKVRLRRRKPARRGDGLIEAAVNAPVPVRDPEKPVAVGGAQLCDLPVLKYPVDYRMVRTELFKRLGIGRIPGLRLFVNRQLKLVEKHLGKLFRRIDVELMPRLEIYRLCVLTAHPVKLIGVFRKPGTVDLEPDLLHPGKNICKRLLDVPVKPVLTRFLQPFGKNRLQRRQHRRGIAPVGKGLAEIFHRKA